MSRTKPLQLGEGRVDLGIFRPGRCRAGNLVGWHDLRADPHGMVRVGGHIDMDADAMPYGELNVPTIKHRQQVVLGLHRRVGAAEFKDRVPLVDDRRTVDALGHQFRLENPGSILQFFRFLLLVDQEQRDAPVIGRLRARPWTRLPGSCDRQQSAKPAFPDRQPMRAATGIPLPVRVGLPDFSLTRYSLLLPGRTGPTPPTRQSRWLRRSPKRSCRKTTGSGPCPAPEPDRSYRPVWFHGATHRAPVRRRRAFRRPLRHRLRLTMKGEQQHRRHRPTLARLRGASTPTKYAHAGRFDDLLLGVPGPRSSLRTIASIRPAVEAARP